MPSTPRFVVTQDADFVYVHVHVPYVRVSEMEFQVDGTEFSFYCKPYLLKLSFPHQLEDNDKAKAVYDPNKDNGTIAVHLPKQSAGQDFPNLDLLTTLLQPTKPRHVDISRQTARASGSWIQVIDSKDSTSKSTESSEYAASIDADVDSATTTLPSPVRPMAASIPLRQRDATLLDLEARMAQMPAYANMEEETTPTIRLHTTKPSYGFNNAYSNVFAAWHGEVSEIVAIPAPEKTAPEQRRILREQDEDDQFDIERYLLDFINAEEDEYFALAMEHTPYWRKRKDSLSDDCKPTIVMITDKLEGLSVEQQAPSAFLTQADRDLMLRLPHKEYLIASGSEDENVALGGLADILVGVVYDELTTQGETGIESAWTTSILSPTLAWLDSTADLHGVVRSAVRRMLAYPLLRQYELAIRVLQETSALLQAGTRAVLHALLELDRVIEKAESRYLLNTLYIQDYCVWIQTLPEDRIKGLGDALAAATTLFCKRDTGWALEEMERALKGADESQHIEEEDMREESESSSDGSSSESSEDSSSDEDDSDNEDASRTSPSRTSAQQAAHAMETSLPFMSSCPKA